jgi:methionine-rich copper-binding protein CopC
MKMFKPLLAAGLIALATPCMAQAEMMESHVPVRLVNVKLIGSDKRPVSIEFSPVMVPNKKFSVPLPTLKPDNYTVHWTTLDENGHKMKGSFGFMQH